MKMNGISLTMRSSMTSIQTVSVFHAVMKDPRAKDAKKAYMYQRRAVSEMGLPSSPTKTLEHCGRIRQLISLEGAVVIFRVEKRKASPMFIPLPPTSFPLTQLHRPSSSHLDRPTCSASTHPPLHRCRYYSSNPSPRHHSRHSDTTSQHVPRPLSLPLQRSHSASERSPDSACPL